MKKLILTLLFMGAVMSQEKFYGFEFVKESGGIKEYTMTSNGLRVLLKQDNTAPVATFMVTYEVGSRNEAIGYTGSTHLLEHLMFKGSRKFNTKKGNSVFQTLQSLGEPVISSVGAFFLFGEPVGLFVFLGGSITLLGVYIIIRNDV
jgi:zinc protease